MARTCAEPPATAVTIPVGETVRTPVFVLLHENTALGTTVPEASRAVATTCDVWPTVSALALVESVTVATGPGPPPVTLKFSVPVTPSLVA